MAVTLHFNPETERKLREQAAGLGLTLEVYLERIAEREVMNGPGPPPQPPSFDEILAPIREGFAQSGMSEDELTALLGEAREEVWHEKQQRKAEG